MTHMKKLSMSGVFHKSNDELNLFLKIISWKFIGVAKNLIIEFYSFFQPDEVAAAVV